MSYLRLQPIQQLLLMFLFMVPLHLELLRQWQQLGI
jgi:hypothetical protein